MQPSLSQTWVISPNTRYVYGTGSTVQAVMQAYMFSVKSFLKTTMGHTVKGSCSAGTGAMDGVDRWTSASTVTPRNNGAAGSQAWVVLTDGNGVDLCLSYNSSADDIFRLAYSPTGIYAAAGTANQQPTATDECFDVATQTWVNAGTSLDRVWHLWATPDKKMWRSAIFRDGVAVSAIGLERMVSALQNPAVFIGPAVFKFYTNVFGYGTGSSVGVYGSSTGGGNTRVHASDQEQNINIGGGGEMYGGAPSAGSLGIDKPALQGGASYVMNPTCMFSATVGGEGKVGNRIDWWFIYELNLITPGDMFGASRFVAVGETCVWPWDGSSLPQVL